ncbi:hypothetical protein JT27_15035, partial [Alcaligenes faecalis]|uniref:hypothetical protein n=1 Tax=Alcaligenes faecalis TaxID=511 RepID=UPI00052E46D6
MIFAGKEQRNFWEVMLKRVLCWLEVPCSWINRTAARWWAEAICFISAALLSGMVVSYWKTDKVYGGQWWEAMTAFGTVGATGIAAYAIWRNRLDAEEKAQILDFVSRDRIYKNVSPVLSGVESYVDAIKSEIIFLNNL